MHELQTAIARALEIDEVHLEYPNDLTHGDFATNVALIHAQQEGTSPRELAEKYAAILNAADISGVKEVSVAGPGFINLHMMRDFFTDSVTRAIDEGDAFGSSDIWKDCNVIVEHSSPNLFKPFHIGHVMNNAVGESMVRLATAAGANVTRLSFPSDVSLGIGKAVWALRQKYNDFKILTTDTERLAFLGECYVEGTKAFEDNEGVQREVRDITTMIYEYEKGDELSHEMELYFLGYGLSLSYFNMIVKRLGSELDGLIFETEAGTRGRDIVRENMPDIFTESDGAVVYDGESRGLHTRVFINSAGYPTYEAKDIGLIALKHERFNPDRSIIVTDHEQREYFKVVQSAAGEINANWSEALTHLTHGRMTFKGKKMSSRLGGIPLGETVLNTLQTEVLERSEHDIDERTADMICIAALKYSILKNALGKNVNFDPDRALSFEGDSGPYVQYTYVRTKSLLEKAADEDITPDNDVAPDEVVEVERLLHRFPDITERATTEYAPHLIVTYITELASAFNSFYASTKILDAENEYASYYLALTTAVGHTLKNGLTLLGIDVPERM